MDVEAQQAKLDAFLLTGVDLLDDTSKNIKEVLLSRSLTPEELKDISIALEALSEGFLYHAIRQSIVDLRRS